MNLFLHSAVVHSLMDQIMSHLNGAFYWISKEIGTNSIYVCPE
jgi:hypothetical protein